MLYNRLLSSEPLIIVGMHRSGTGLLSEIVQRLGCFMGKNLSPNNESLYFQTLNKEALDIIGANWSNIKFLPECGDLTNYYEWLTRFMTSRLKKGFIRDHFGILRACYFSVRKDLPWGWKDPRNSLLLPKWLQIFPNAKIIHIYRDGRDVALSLLRRDMKREKNKSYFSRQLQHDKLTAYFSLWEEYIQRITTAVRGYHRVHEIRYESLLRNPKKEISQIKKYCRTDSSANLHEIASMVDPSRSHRYRNKYNRWIHSIEFNKSVLKQLNYV